MGLEAAPGAGYPTIIGGNLTINTLGNLDTTRIGDGSTIPPHVTGGIAAEIDGSVSFNLGNGNDTITFAGGGTVAGPVVVRAGNGTSNLTFMEPGVFNINAIFGNGNNSVILDDPGAVLIGYLAGGSGTNSLIELAGTIGSPFHEQNF